MVLVLWLGVPAAGADGDAWARAIHARDATALQRLLATQRDVNEPTLYGKTALMAGAAARNRNLVHDLLRRGANVTTSNKRGGTALMYAAWGGDLEIVRALHAAGADPHQRAENGWTALGLAAVKGHLAVVTYLLDSGVDPNVPDVYGWTPLMRAVQSGRSNTVTALLVHDTVELARINGLGRTALHIAYLNRRCALGERLRAAGLDPEQSDFKGHRAADYRRMLCRA